MEEQLIELLKANKLKITTAESCTGGLLADRIVSVPSASEVFEQGFVTYSEKSKHNLLSVKYETIEKYNVVSEEVAYEMAVGAAKASKCQVAISTTGLAGPGGGTDEIKVGTVCFGIYVKGNVITKKYIFEGDRQKVRVSACDKIFELLKEILEKSQNV